MFECRKFISNRNSNIVKIRTLLSKNDLDPKIDLMHHLLPPLNDIKEIFLAHIYIAMTMFKLEKGAIGHKKMYWTCSKTCSQWLMNYLSFFIKCQYLHAESPIHPLHMAIRTSK